MTATSPTPRDQERQALRELLLEMIERLGQPAPIYGINPNLSSGALARQLWTKLGRRKALILRTKLTGMKEADDRKPCPGHSRAQAGWPGNDRQRDLTDPAAPERRLIPTSRTAALDAPGRP